jgi:hypothetical protein
MGAEPAASTQGETEDESNKKRYAAEPEYPAPQQAISAAPQEAAMNAPLHPNERLAIVEQKVSHVEAELDKVAVKVDEMHAILLQARGVRWAVIAVAGLVGFLAGVSHWLIGKP